MHTILKKKTRNKALKATGSTLPSLQTFFSLPMADFSFLSDTDDSAVEEIISQANDLLILEQVAAINCSAFSDSVLPTELETRFRKLKSFPSSKNSGLRTELRTRSAKGGTGSECDDEAVVFPPSKQNPCGRLKGGFGFSPGEGDPDGKSVVFSPSKKNGGADENAMFSPGKENPEGNFSGSKRNVIFSPSKQYPDENFTGSKKNMMFSPSKQTPTEKKSGLRNPNSGSLSSPSSDSSDFSMDSRPPPQKTGCFLCSLKSPSKKKSKKNQSWSKKDELVSDLSIFTEKSQRKILKKAMKEEEKINREAEKIVKWAKQASARMNISDIEDGLSDDDKFK